MSQKALYGAFLHTYINLYTIFASKSFLLRLSSSVYMLQKSLSQRIMSTFKRVLHRSFTHTMHKITRMQLHSRHLLQYFALLVIFSHL